MLQKLANINLSLCHPKLRKHSVQVTRMKISSPSLVQLQMTEIQPTFWLIQLLT